MKKALVLAVLLCAACTPDVEQHAHPRRWSGTTAAPIRAPQDRDFQSLRTGQNPAPVS